MALIPTPIEEIPIPFDLSLMIKRDDLIHPTIMGNKWRKLKHNLEQAKKDNKQTLLTFGGAYSNHIAATAAAAKEYGFQSLGIIRGNELNPQSNPTLQFAHDCGMKLVFESRERFKVLKNDFDQVNKKHPDVYILPEGGTNGLAIRGASEIIQEIDRVYDYVICPIGTGGTMAGILSKLPEEKTLIGISSLKGAFIHEEFSKLLAQYEISKTNYEIMDQYHFGGYGKTTAELISFINEFKTNHGIPLDPVYTGKTMFAIHNLIANNYFPKNSKILTIHTGGLQGIAGFNEKHGKKIL